jgi:hypothetical protein
MKAFFDRLNITAETRVLDVGGSEAIWELAPVRPKLTIVNLYPKIEVKNGSYLRGSGRAIPFADKSFDVVFSNSVIEHLGSWSAIEELSTEIRRVGKRYWVQTPNRYFPFELHYLAPFIHFAPKALQKRVLRYGSGWGLLTKPTPKQVAEYVEELHLLGRRDLGRLFPEAELRGERFMGLVKSLVAWA